MQWDTNGHAALKFVFELVHDGLNLGAGNSVGRLKFKQNWRASSDHILDSFRIIHERRLTWMQNDPCRNKTCHDDTKGEVIVPLGLIGKQDNSGRNNERQGNENEGILT
jgi:hypothetical protein